jgi:hypothetical protein
MKKVIRQLVRQHKALEGKAHRIHKYTVKTVVLAIWQRCNFDDVCD